MLTRSLGSLSCGEEEPGGGCSQVPDQAQRASVKDRCNLPIGFLDSSSYLYLLYAGNEDPWG